MRTVYRKQHPYYGKYKIKISMYHNSWQYMPTENSTENNILYYFRKNFKEEIDFRWHDNWNIYLKDIAVFDDIYKQFPNYITTIYRPAVGYEHLKRFEGRKKPTLWYEKYSYKIVLKDINRINRHLCDKWCDEHSSADWRASMSGNGASYYFMNSFDAMAFKLAFSDNVVKSISANTDKAKKLLKARVERATKEYIEYLEGENETET